MTASTRITVAHSPDTDDVFMFWALATEQFETPGRDYVLVAKDIEVLNREALAQVYDVTAISYGAYPWLHRYYSLVDSGGSIGEGYGPVLVAQEQLSFDALKGMRIAIPGRMTTAFLAARILLPPFEPVELPFKDIGPAVAAGRVDAGLLIHEGQITWREQGLKRILDLGELWWEREQLPLPLGANVLRRDLERPLRLAIVDDLKKSILHALGHRDEALEYTLARCPGLDRAGYQHYLDMYVSSETVSVSERTVSAARRLFARARALGVIDEDIPLDILRARI